MGWNFSITGFRDEVVAAIQAREIDPEAPWAAQAIRARTMIIDELGESEPGAIVTVSAFGTVDEGRRFLNVSIG